jgi:hypothetical protein
MTLAEVRRLDEVVLLRYLLAPGGAAADGDAPAGEGAAAGAVEGEPERDDG